MKECKRCGKPNPADIHTCTPQAVIIRNAYLKGMADGAESVSRWVSVDKALPPLKEWVVVYSDKFPLFVARLIDNGYSWERINPSIDDIKRKVHDSFNCYSHWMPIPEPPSA